MNSRRNLSQPAKIVSSRASAEPNSKFKSIALHISYDNIFDFSQTCA